MLEHDSVSSRQMVCEQRARTLSDRVESFEKGTSSATDRRDCHRPSIAGFSGAYAPRDAAGRATGHVRTSRLSRRLHDEALKAPPANCSQDEYKESQHARPPLHPVSPAPRGPRLEERGGDSLSPARRGWSPCRQARRLTVPRCHAQKRRPSPFPSRASWGPPPHRLFPMRPVRSSSP